MLEYYNYKVIKMNSINSNNKNEIINIYELWKDIQIKLLDAKNSKIIERKNLLNFYKNQYAEIINEVIKIDDNTYEFNLANLIKIAKYINHSNSFFNNRISAEFIDEILILVYLYEWICLKYEKDPNILGIKEEVIDQFRILTFKTNSEYQKIFDNIDLNSQEGQNLFAIRIKNATFKAYNSLIILISRDNIYFSKIDNDQVFSLNSLKEDYFIKLWKDTFILEEDRVTYSYSIINSDETFIFINVETKNEQVAFVKFRMFQTFSLKNGIISLSGISKEILRIEFLNQKYEVIGASIISNSLKLANRVIKNIFWPNLKNQNLMN